MNKLILPVNQPYIAVMPEHAHVFAILGDYEAFKPWCLSNFIQVFNNGLEAKSLIRFYDDHRLLTFCPWIQGQLLNKLSVEYWHSHIIHFLKDCIDQGYYVVALLDSLFIKSFKGITGNRPHLTMIYGYDLMEKTFYIADFFEHKYEFSHATFEEIEQAYTSIEYDQKSHYTANIILMTKRQASNYSFDIQNVTTLLMDYLDSKNTSRFFSMYSNNLNPAKFGVSTYNNLLSLIDTSIDSNYSYIDRRPFQLLSEHKHLMQIRTNYLIENGYMDRNDKLSEELSLIINECLIIRNLILKYNMTKSQKILESIKPRIMNVIQTEKYALEQLIDQIKRNNYIDV
ncbi:hypothetical protein [Paenibacillus sp. N3.4]|uniref:hypothetical protein n=1 Tax=Paenibacillus sp. N3.4 TaxID=2603222 RepID=UPI0011CA1E88|nr:hypothetical protein [Paenibacillus sp. N3.4]TXK84590.1 hypothetical protein FU659_08190 [Paenibacillus sp. N3.4]